MLSLISIPCKANVFESILESACLNVCLCVFLCTNISFCQSTGVGIKSHLVIALVLFVLGMPCISFQSNEQFVW